MQFTWLGKLLPTSPGVNAVVKLKSNWGAGSRGGPELLNLELLVLLYGGFVLWRNRPTSAPHASTQIPLLAETSGA